MFEECLYFNSNALARHVNRIWTEAYQPFELSPPHAFLLRLILAKPGLMPREIATELQLSRSTVTRFLDSLEKRNFLVREYASSDAREILVYPTDNARAIHQALDETGKALSRRMNDILGETTLASTIKQLREFKNQLKE